MTLDVAVAVRAMTGKPAHTSACTERLLDLSNNVDSD